MQVAYCQVLNDSRRPAEIRNLWGRRFVIQPNHKKRIKGRFTAQHWELEGMESSTQLPPRIRLNDDNTIDIDLRLADFVPAYLQQATLSRDRGGDKGGDKGGESSPPRKRQRRSGNRTQSTHISRSPSLVGQHPISPVRAAADSLADDLHQQKREVWFVNKSSSDVLLLDEKHSMLASCPDGEKVLVPNMFIVADENEVPLMEDTPFGQLRSLDLGVPWQLLGVCLVDDGQLRFQDGFHLLDANEIEKVLQ